MKVYDSRFNSEVSRLEEDQNDLPGVYKLQTRITFECAHRLYDVNTYSEECRNNIHGHSYALTLVVSRSELNEASMIIDFKLLKKLLKAEIEDVYDHSCIVKRSDPLAPALVANCKNVHIVDENPTAEWMCKHFADLVQKGLDAIDPKVRVVSVAVQETENNIAIYEV